MSDILQGNQEDEFEVQIPEPKIKKERVWNRTLVFSRRYYPKVFSALGCINQDLHAIIPDMEKRSCAGDRWELRKEVEQVYKFFARVAELSFHIARWRL